MQVLFKSVSQDHEDIVILWYLQGDHNIWKTIPFFNLPSHNFFEIILLTRQNFVLVHIHIRFFNINSNFKDKHSPLLAIPEAIYKQKSVVYVHYLKYALLLLKPALSWHIQNGQNVYFFNKIWNKHDLRIEIIKSEKLKTLVC